MWVVSVGAATGYLWVRFGKDEGLVSVEGAIAGAVGGGLVYAGAFFLNLSLAPARIQRERISAERSRVEEAKERVREAEAKAQAAIAEREALLDERPVLDPEPKVSVASKGNVFLEVSNGGATADFFAEIIVTSLEGISVPSRIKAYWDFARDWKCLIPHGQKEPLRIARCSFDPRRSGRFVLYGYDRDTNGISSYDSNATIVGGKEKGVIEPYVEFEVRISADPALRNGIWSDRFRLSAKGLEKISE